MRGKYHYFTNYFTEEQLKYIDDLPKNFQEGSLMRNNGEIDTSMRKSNISWIKDPKVKEWITQVVYDANSATFGVEIDHLKDIQYTIYDGNDEGFYDWHRDEGMVTDNFKCRKLSFVMLLNDMSEYDGGEFEAEWGIPYPEEFSERGDIIVFPSFYKHRVKPVTKGIRKSLVAWFLGPTWR